MPKRFHLHLVSDSTGETVSSITRSVMSQFEDIESQEHTWSMIRTKGQMARVVEGIRKTPGIVMYTIIDEVLQKELKQVCKEMKIPCVPVLSRPTRELSSFLGVDPKQEVGRQYELDEDYFARVEAINFTLAHDDGHGEEDLEESDIILIGVSRTSKTPTCVYLSYRGIKVSNIPYVQGCPLPEKLFGMKGPLIIGLVISPDRLIQIRKSRLISLNENRDTNYVDLDHIKDEVAESRRLFNKHGWPIIDVTRRSVEETTANIMQYYSKFKAEEK